MKTRGLISLFTVMSLLCDSCDLSAMDCKLEVRQFAGPNDARSAPIVLTIDGQTMNTSTFELSNMCQHGRIGLERFPGFFVERSTNALRSDSVVISRDNTRFTISTNERNDQIYISSNEDEQSLSIKAPYNSVCTDAGLRAKELT